MQSGVEHILSVADRIRREADHTFSMMDACSSAMEKVQSKAEPDASATEYISSGMDDNFSKGVHVASDPGNDASAVENSNSAPVG
jgi:hypothetical protein